MPLQYVKTKDQLPIDSDYNCPICMDNIDLDETVYGVPNCVICGNGHRMHNSCFNQTRNHECPSCKTQVIKFCKSQLGYSYVEREGGKKRKTHKKKKTYQKNKYINGKKVKSRRKLNKSSKVYFTK